MNVEAVKTRRAHDKDDAPARRDGAVPNGRPDRHCGLRRPLPAPHGHSIVANDGEPGAVRANEQLPKTASGGLLYTASITTAALVVLLAPTPVRRRDARKVLALLLRRTFTENPNHGKPTQQ
ncbi:hypothetical protein [Micromonospora sp. NPDC049204]|uniref:hypothetical protein n=1 Tax=Micromonospora sp. NPDC049204 TaxID=3154351 RepID=UPI0033E5965E